MQNTAAILKFEPKRKELNAVTKKKRIVNIDGIKYFTQEQIRLFRRTVRDQAIVSISKGNVTGVREWAVVDLLTSSGLRVGEASNLRCADVKTAYGECSVFVRDGKNGKSRTVQIPNSLKRHLKSFINWKKLQGEATGPDDFLFIGQRGPWSSQGIQQIVKKYLKRLDIYECGKNVHSLRHSYATELYRREKDIRVVQRQLGHASIQTTMIYAGVHVEDVQRQLKGLWSA